ncbi:MAG: GNAT family N-acetyltransferase [Marinilabiliaceae bacterium]|nr:GNAT family N-acetyltransferase [Marinilabiliaceae bacterium]
MKIEVKTFEELRNSELYNMLQLRAEVFVVEQDCVYNDIDGMDQQGLHVLAKVDGKIIGYTRLLKAGTRFETASIGRMVVDKDYRFKGYAREIMEYSIGYIHKSWNESIIHISAQQYLKGFYGSIGFKIVTEPYLEDGIPHVGMDINVAVMNQSR